MKFVVQTTDGKELALFENQYAAEQWVVDQLKTNKMKFGTFVIVEIEKERCPHCGEVL